MRGSAGAVVDGDRGRVGGRAPAHAGRVLLAGTKSGLVLRGDQNFHFVKYFAFVLLGTWLCVLGSIEDAKEGILKIWQHFSELLQP